MVTDPPPDDEDPERDPGDGSVDGDPIEEVDFWDEVGETRPPQEGDLSGGTGGLDPDETRGADVDIDEAGPSEADEAPPEAGERWPELDERDDRDEADGTLPQAGEPWPELDESDVADEPAPPPPEGPHREPDPEPAEEGDADPAGPDRPSSEIDAEERLSGSGPRGIDLGLGPDDPGDEPGERSSGEPGEPDPAGAEARREEPEPPDPEVRREEPEPPDPETGPRPTAEAREGSEPEPPSEPQPGEPGEGEVVPEPEAQPEPTEPTEPAEAEAVTEPEPGAADGEATEVVTEPSPEADETPEIPRLRERGPVEAGAHPRAEVEEAQGPCHLCAADQEEPPEGRHTCVSCERPACSSHFWVMFALCEGCATEDQIRKLRGERTGDDWSQFLEIKWVD